MDNVNILTVKQLKEKIKLKENITGLSFVNDRGSRGTVLDGVSAHGKRQAEMTCTVNNCTEIHIREQSDWHQSYVCRTHSKHKKPNGLNNNLNNNFKLQQVLETDSADVVTMKEQNNTLYLAEKNRLAEERKAKNEAIRAARAVEKARASKATLAANLKRMREFAERMNVPINDVTIQQLEESESSG